MVINQMEFIGYQLKKEITDHIDFPNLDKFFFKTFCNSIPKIPEDIDDKKLREYLSFNFGLQEKACCIILCQLFGNKIFSVSPFYMSELCTSLIITEISPQKYYDIVAFFIDENISSLINEVCDRNYNYGYTTIFTDLIERFRTCPNIQNERNKILKFLYTLLEQDYHYLFENAATLEEIVDRLLTKMYEANNDNLIYKASDFRNVTIFKNLIPTMSDENKKAITTKLLECELTTDDYRLCIRKCLATIKDYLQQPIQLVRKRDINHENYSN